MAFLAVSCSGGGDAANPEPSRSIDLKTAEAVARASCASCHLYPDPNLLEREAWSNRVLPRMKLLMGLEKPDPARMHNPELAKLTNLFPAIPLASQEAWTQIEAFYLAKAPATQPPLGRPPINDGLSLFKPEPLKYSIPGPTTTYVEIDDESQSVVFSDGKLESLVSVEDDSGLQWSLQVSNIIVSVPKAGAKRFIVGIGDFFPSDDTYGQVLLHDPFAAGPTVSVVLNDLPRVTHLEPADLNQDGKVDFALSMFGNMLGRFSWFEATQQQGEQLSFKEHRLFNDPGALKSMAHDFNDDGLPDLVMLAAQAKEGLLVYTNLGNGKFGAGDLFRKPPSFGHTDFQLADFNGDGQVDYLVANGDNADFQTEPRPYQGIRIYLSEAAGVREAYFFPFYGAYQMSANDFDLDGDMDIAAVAFFPDYKRNPEPFVYLENLGGLKFQARTFAGANSGRWLTLDAGDLDGDGDVDLVLGALVDFPDNAPEHYRSQWHENSPSVLILRNQLR